MTGGGRAGWYSRDWLDNNGKPSADRIAPGWQSLDVGMQLKGPGKLVDRGDRGAGAHFGAAVELWVAAGPFFWSAVRSLPPDAAGRDVGLSSASGSRRPDPTGDPHPERGRPRLVTRPFGLLVGEPGHFIMQTRQFRNLRARVAAKA